MRSDIDFDRIDQSGLAQPGRAHDNQLAIIRIDAELQNLAAKSDTVAAFNRLEAAVDIIDEALNNISEESLARWRSRYDVPTPPFAE